MADAAQPVATALLLRWQGCLTASTAGLKRLELLSGSVLMLLLASLPFVSRSGLAISRATTCSPSCLSITPSTWRVLAVSGCRSPRHLISFSSSFQSISTTFSSLSPLSSSRCVSACSPANAFRLRGPSRCV